MALAASGSCSSKLQRSGFRPWLCTSWSVWWLREGFLALRELPSSSRVAGPPGMSHRVAWAGSPLLTVANPLAMPVGCCFNARWWSGTSGLVLIVVVWLRIWDYFGKNTLHRRKRGQIHPSGKACSTVLSFLLLPYPSFFICAVSLPACSSSLHLSSSVFLVQ